MQWKGCSETRLGRAEFIGCNELEPDHNQFTRWKLMKTATTPARPLAFLFFALLTQFATAEKPSVEDEPKPNFVVIFTDDQGYQDLGCYGSPDIKTPHIDRMAKEGMKFTSFYAQTVCGPSRTALMTGCYPMRTERHRGDDGKIPHPALSLNEVTLPEILKPLGYQTAMIGKWDLSGRRRTFQIDLNPSNQGFDCSFWTETSGDGPIREGAAIAVRKPTRSTLTTLYTDKAIEFMEQKKDQPFFLYLAHVMPHTKLAVSEEFKGKSDGGFYGDVIEEIDHNVGRLLTRVKELGLDGNTYVIFTSDNGPWWREGDHAGHCEPLRSAKTSTYEGGIRVPFIIRAPWKTPEISRPSITRSSGTFAPASLAMVGSRSIFAVTRSQVVPAGTFPGARMIKGTLRPPS